MEYTRQNFKNGQVLSAEHLEHIEDGILSLLDAITEGGTENVDSPIKYVESTDEDNLLNLRDFESGTYVLYGKFHPFSGSTASITFGNALLVNIITKTTGTHVQVFYPVNNCVQFLEITDDSYERTNVYLNDMLAGIGTLSNLATTSKTSLVDAINELVENNTNPVARIANVELLAANWVGETNPYSQKVVINGVTENSQVDLTPSVEQLVIFYEKDLTFVTENDGGEVTVYAIGQKPTNDYTIQVTITEVSV